VASSARAGEVWTTGQRVKNDAIHVVLRVALRCADRTPARWLLALGRALGWITHLTCGSLRDRARENLALALPGRPSAELARASFVRAGENLARCLLLRRPEVHALDFVHVPEDSRAVLTATLAEGRGAVFVSAHLGPFELLAAALAELGLHPAVVVRESYDARLDPLVDRHRVERGVQVIHRGRPGAPLRVLRALRAGSPVGFLPDLGGRVPTQPAELLGLRVDLPVGPQRIAARAGCPVLVGTLAPGSAGPRFELRISRVADGAEAALGAAIAAELSARIRASAEHWPWMAPRFRSLQHNPVSL
jgi:Kdo2-lipid IVA lauroyltransferase/acyltransferase